MAPSSPGSRPRPPGGLRPALTPTPGDAHRQRRGAGSNKPRSPRFQGIAKVLMENAGRVLHREDLLTRVWGPERGRLSNTMSVVTSRLRRKLLRPDGTSRIRTIPTVGYILDTGRLD